MVQQRLVGLVGAVLGVYEYQPNIPAQAVGNQIVHAIIVPGSRENYNDSNHMLITIGVRTSWLDDYIGHFLGTFDGVIEHIPTMNTHRNYTILDSGGNNAASYFGTLKVAFLPEDQGKVRLLMSLLYRALIGRDGHIDLEARSMADDFDHLSQRAFKQAGTIASRFFPDTEAILGHHCVRQLAGGFVGPFQVNGLTKNIRAVIDEEASKDWQNDVFHSFKRQDVEHVIISYKRVPYDLESTSMSEVHPRVVISMDQSQWEEAMSGAMEMVARKRKCIFFLWLDELATFRSAGTDWTKMGFLPYGTFPTVIVGRAYGGGQADMNAGIWTHNERLLTEFGQGWIKRGPEGFLWQEGIGMSPFKALTKMAGIYLSGRPYQVSDYWSTRLDSFRKLCTRIAASEYPVGALCSLEDGETYNPMNINRAVQAATIYTNNNRFLRDRFRNLFPETFVIPRSGNRPWFHMLEAVPRINTVGVNLDFDNASIELWKVVRTSQGRVYVVCFSPQGDACICIRVQLSGNPFDETNAVLEAKRVPLAALSESELDDIERRFTDRNNSVRLSSLQWAYAN